MDLVYKLKKIVGSNNFSAQFIKIISRYKKIGYNINVLQQTICLVVDPITVGNFAFLFNHWHLLWVNAYGFQKKIKVCQSSLSSP